MSENRSLKSENLIKRSYLLNKVVSLNEFIKPGFNFGLVTREENPREYFVGLVLNKIYSLNISIENCIFSNDVFLSIYLYRYVYELYIKISYIFSETSEDKNPLRLNEFFENKKWTLADIKDKINNNVLFSEFTKDHRERYNQICKFVHPNIDSLKLHLNRTDDQQFEFIVPNVNLTIWYIVEIIIFFSNLKLLDLDKKIDLNKLNALRNS
jgi:hypothetical protein